MKFEEQREMCLWLLSDPIGIYFWAIREFQEWARDLVCPQIELPPQVKGLLK